MESWGYGVVRGAALAHDIPQTEGRAPADRRADAPQEVPMADIEVRTSGSAITMSTADRIVIRLPENATTGYQWSIVQLGEPLEVVSNKMIPPGQMAAGAAGERVVI